MAKQQRFSAYKNRFYRKQKHIEDVFVVLHFNSPQHFACLHVTESTLVYYDSLKNNNRRPYSEYPDLSVFRDIIEIHEPKVWQREAECGCMVVLRYWQLFHSKRYTLKGKEARAQVLKYYNRDNNKGVKGTENCDEEQLRSRTALTRKGPFSRLLGSSSMKRI